MKMKMKKNQNETSENNSLPFNFPLRFFDTISFFGRKNENISTKSFFFFWKMNF